MKKTGYPLNTIFTNDSMKLAESVLTMVLKSKVKSHSGKESLSVKDKRRIETYLPILTGEDVQMKEELLSEISLWLLEHDNTFESIYHAGNDKVEVIFYDGYFLELLQYVGDVMKSHKQNIGYQRITVNKLNDNGTIARYPLSEKDIEQGRKIGRPIKKEYVTISRLDIVTEEGVKTLDSKEYSSYLRSIQLDEMSQKELKVFLNDLSKRVPQEHFIAWFRYYTSKVSERNAILENLANNFNVTLSTIYRWKDRVDKVMKEMKQARVKDIVGYNTNNVVYDSSQAKVKCCAYIPSFDGKEKGYSKTLENDNCVISDSAIGCINWNINTTEKECMDTFLKVEKVGIDWMWLIENSCFAEIGYNVKRHKSKVVKYIPKKTAHGQGLSPYDEYVRLLHDVVTNR